LNLHNANGNQVTYQPDANGCADGCGNNYTLSNACCSAVTLFNGVCYPKGLDNVLQFETVSTFASSGRTSTIFMPC
jgi:hypothetical protein